MENNIKPFGLRDKIGYLFGDFGNDFTFLISSTFLLKFYTDVRGLDAYVVGLVMMSARFIDALVAAHAGCALSVGYSGNATVLACAAAESVFAYVSSPCECPTVLYAFLHYAHKLVQRLQAYGYNLDTLWA